MDLPVLRFLTTEAAVTYFGYTTQFDSRESYLFPEVGAHFVLPTRVIRPYLLAGLGVALSVEGSGPSDITGHAGLGLRSAFSDAYGMRVEARFRNITFNSNASLFEIFLGLSRRW